MDQLITEYKEQLTNLETKLKLKIQSIPEWKINELVPINIKAENIEVKQNFLINKFRSENFQYIILNNDISFIQTHSEITQKDLEILKIDPRFLEGKGMKQHEIDEFMSFATKIQNLIETT